MEIQLSLLELIEQMEKLIKPYFNDLGEPLPWEEYEN